MSILFLSRSFYPQIGGVEKHVMEISKLLIQKGHTVTVITELPTSSAQKGPIGQDCVFFEIDGINVYRIRVEGEGKGKKFQIWKGMWKLRKAVEDADIVHCHDVFFWYLPFRFLYPKKSVYTTFHGYESYPIKKKAIWVRKLSEKLSWGNICIGDFIPKWYGTKADYVSYGAVALKIPRPAGHPLYVKGVGGDSPVVRNNSAVFIGRLDEQTGILDYVKAVELIKKQFPKFALLIVGDGKYKKQIKKAANILGFRQDPEIYFHHYHFAFVSRYLSILEAMAAKRLIFALYDNPVKEDYLRMSPFSSWIIIARNSQELADKIIYYLQHPGEEKKLTDKAFHWVSRQTWEKMTDLYLRLWKRN